MASTMRKVQMRWSMRFWDSSWRKYWDSGGGGNAAYVRLALQMPRLNGGAHVGRGGWRAPHKFGASLHSGQWSREIKDAIKSSMPLGAPL